MLIHDLGVILTNNCNLMCDYCFAGAKNSTRMSIETARRIIDWLNRVDVSGPGNVWITFFGGEPFMEFPLMKEMVHYAEMQSTNTGKAIGFSATTNGTLLADNEIDFCEEHDIALLLSCDGNESTHNIHRRFRNGRGTFRAVERSLDVLLNRGISRGVRMTITAQNIEGFLDSVYWLVDRGVEYIQFSHNPYSDWTEEALRKFEDSLYNLADYYSEEIANGSLLSLNAIDWRIRVFQDSPSRRRNENLCHAGASHMTVGLDGELYPCEHFAACSGFRGMIPLGSIRSGIDEVRRLPLLRLRRKHLMGCDIPCDLCSVRDYCTIGCPALNFELTGHLALNPPHMRYFATIWHDVIKALLEHFERSPSQYFDKRFPRAKNEDGNEMPEKHSRNTAVTISNMV